MEAVWKASRLANISMCQEDCIPQTPQRQFLNSGPLQIYAPFHLAGQFILHLYLKYPLQQISDNKVFA